MSQKEELFGFELETSKKDQLKKSPIPTQMDDGTDMPVGGVVGSAYEQDLKQRSEASLVQQYRDISLYPEADAAIDDIVNEMFTTEFERQSVSIRLDVLNVDDRIKDIIRKEFKSALHLLNFNKKNYDLVRQWYIDGRLYFQVVLDEKKPKNGIVELRPMDAAKTARKVIPEYEKDPRTGIPLLKKVNEFFEFSYDGSKQNQVKLAKDSVVFCPSGMVDRNRGLVVGYLDKAIKPFNNLRSMEDSLIVYRIARAPERRIFYVDVGQMPKIKAEQYLRDMMNRYRNKIDYNPNSGEIRDGRKFMSMLEDFWLPRRDGSKGTEITTLPGGQNLGDLDDVNYFKDKLYQSLNVPMSRMNQDNTFQLGRASDISRDELKFSKFIKRLRKQFSEVFNEILRIQLVIKGVCTQREFAEMRQYIGYDFLKDMHFDQLKELEIMQDRLNLLQNANDYVGKYFSIEYVRKNILGQTEEDISRLDREIMSEIEKQQIVTTADQLVPESYTIELQEDKVECPEISIQETEINNIEDEEYKKLMEAIREAVNDK